MAKNIKSFSGKVLLITGGTGSFGNATLRHFLSEDLKEIRIFSRDEKKQDAMRKKYNSKKIKFYIGDVRDSLSVENAVEGSDYIFHAAALKQVPSCEFYPLEAVKTNILGTNNVLDSAIKNNVKRVVVLSTDKAVYPINAMGLSKGLMEKVVLARSRNSRNTNINITRYGNVMASRGSVIPLFIDQILNSSSITITDPKMTRFIMSLDDAVDLVLYAFENGKRGEIFVQKSPASTIDLLANTLKDILGYKEKPISVIGTRHGEKLYETLLSREEMLKSVDLGNFYKVLPDDRDLNYSKYVDQGEQNLSIAEEYNSHNTKRLNKKELTKLLLKLPEIKLLLD